MGKRKELPRNLIECRDTQKGEEEPNLLKILTHTDLVIMTDNFRKENCIGSYQFGKLYRGVLDEQHFTIKTWDTPEIDETTLGNHERRLMDELIMLRHERLLHPCIPSLYGYCRDKNRPAVVYNLKSLDSLLNLLPSEDFTWVQRIEAAFEFASLLMFLHKRLGDLDPFVIRNLAAEHVILDEKFNPKLVDFSMITGGIFPNRHAYCVQPSYGGLAYRDPDLFQDLPAHIATWTKKSDVYAFGIMLLSLVSKQITTEEMCCMDEITVVEWAHEKNKLGESLVHESLQTDASFYDVDGSELSMIGMACIADKCQDRLSMKEVVNRLLDLLVLHNQKELLIKNLHPYFSLDTGKNKKQISDIKYRDTKIDDLSYFMSNDIMRFTVRRLKYFTNNFSENNYIGKFQFGKIFRGVKESCASGDRYLIVKIWDNEQNPEHNLLRLGDEMLLLHHEMYICHPGMVRMMGYCIEDEYVAIVLFLKSENSIHNLLSSGDFKWLHRTKAACGVASLLKFLHVVPHRMDPFVIRNLRSSHILLDEEYNPKLVDFGMIIGGIFPSLGRQDRVEPANDIHGTWTTKDDVLSFGLLLQCLISGKMKIEPNDRCLATSNDIEKTLVHERLQKDPTYYHEDGQEITRLIVQCVQPDSTCRPTMSEVVEAFHKLKVVETHQEIMCLENMFRDKCSAEKPEYPSKPNMPRRHCLGN